MYYFTRHLKLLLFAGMLCVLGGLVAPAVGQQAVQKETQQNDREGNRRAFEERRRAFLMHAVKLLRDANVAFDPEVFLSLDWRTKLPSILSQLPEGKKELHISGPLRGVYIADTIYIPGKPTLEGDAVLITRKLFYRLEEDNKVIIRGPYNLYEFAYEGHVMLDKDGQRLPRAMITIDKSGKKGEDGQKGKDGTKP